MHHYCILCICDIYENLHVTKSQISASQKLFRKCFEVISIDGDQNRYTYPFGVMLRDLRKWHIGIQVTFFLEQTFEIKQFLYFLSRVIPFLSIATFTIIHIWSNIIRRQGRMRRRRKLAIPALLVHSRTNKSFVMLPIQGNVGSGVYVKKLKNVPQTKNSVFLVHGRAVFYLYLGCISNYSTCLTSDF